MKWLILFLSVLVCQSSFASVYVLGQGGYFSLRQSKAQEHSVTPSGTSFGGGLGLRKEFYEVEALFLKANADDDVVHDDQKNTMVHEQSSVILALNFYLTKKFYARLGYGFTRVDQELKKEISEASAEGAKEIYGLRENKLTDGPVFGAGAVIFNGKRMTLFTQAEYQNYSSIEAGAWNVSLGFRFYFSR